MLWYTCIISFSIRNVIYENYLKVICGEKYISTMDIAVFSNLHVKNSIKLILLGIVFFIFIIPVSVTSDSMFHEQNNSFKNDNNEISILPFQITQSGVYSLNSNLILNNTAITITSSNVIIDGQGHSISGNLTPGSVGILIYSEKSELTNVTIRNITVQEFDIGIKLQNVSQSQYIESDVLSNLRSGFMIESSNSIKISEGKIKNNRNDITGGYGIQILNSHHIIVNNSLVTGNGKSGKPNSGGITFLESTYSDLIKCQIISNPGFGIKGDSKSDYLTISECDIVGNSGDGIIISNSRDPTIQKCTINKNKESGIEFSHVMHPSVTGNQISSGMMGISLSETSDMVLSYNKLSNNRIGFDISASKIQYLSHQISSSNTIDSRKLLYLNNEQNKTIGPSDNPSFILAVNCSNISISEIVLSKNCAGIILAGCQNISLSDISFIENGIGLWTLFNTTGLTCTRLHAERNLVSGYYLSQTHQFQLQNLYAQDSPSGMYIQKSDDGYAEKIFITSISGLKNRMPSGITLSGCNNFTITQSQISQCSYAGLLSDSTNLNVSRNVFSENSYAGSVILSGPVKILKNSYLKNENSGLIVRGNNSEILENTISDNTIQGLLLLNGHRNFIAGNVFKNIKNYELSSDAALNNWNYSPESSLDSTRKGGNFWSDPDGEGYSDLCSVDTMGYCIDPYIINAENIDYHPLTFNNTWKSLYLTTDINQNGREELQDVVLYMKKVTAGEEELFDYSGDGKINLNDVVALFRIISQKQSNNFS